MNLLHKFLLSVCIFSSIPFCAYADDSVWLRSISIAQTEDGYSVGEEGETRLIDSSGRIRATDSSGEWIVSGEDSYGQIYDENGYLVNLGSLYTEKYEDMAENFDQGYGVKLDNLEDFKNFLEYYVTQYSYSDPGLSYTMRNNVCFNNIKYTYDRSELENQISEIFGAVEGDSIAAKIEDACRKVSDKLDYDSSYIRRSMPDCLEDGKAVCWQYAKIVKYLLEQADVYPEIVIGKSSDYRKQTNYMWLRCWDTDRWIYFDPSGFEQQGSDPSYCDISYLGYLIGYYQVPSVTVQADRYGSLLEVDAFGTGSD